MNSLSTPATTSLKSSAFSKGSGVSVGSSQSEHTHIPQATNSMGPNTVTPLQKSSTYVRHEDADNAASHPRVTKSRTYPTS